MPILPMIQQEARAQGMGPRVRGNRQGRGRGVVPQRRVLAGLRSQRQDLSRQAQDTQDSSPSPSRTSTRRSMAMVSTSRRSISTRPRSSRIKTPGMATHSRRASVRINLRGYLPAPEGRHPKEAHSHQAYRRLQQGHEGGSPAHPRGHRVGPMVSDFFARKWARDRAGFRAQHRPETSAPGMRAHPMDKRPDQADHRLHEAQVQVRFVRPLPLPRLFHGAADYDRHAQQMVERRPHGLHRRAARMGLWQSHNHAARSGHQVHRTHDHLAGHDRHPHRIRHPCMRRRPDVVAAT